jgi:peptidoglycan hydrolase-like amidase
MDPSSPRRNRLLVGAAGTALLVAGTVAGGLAAGPAAGVGVRETVTIGSAKTLSVQYRGNGHGHGMSQYGARGAARAGLTYPKILAFYYPGTTLTTLPRRMIRVKLTDTGITTTVQARSRMTVTGVSGFLPTTGVAKYRLVAGSGTTLTLQKLASATGAVWRAARTGLPNRSEFFRHGIPMRFYENDGDTTDYAGHLRAVRSGRGVITVNRLLLDKYVAGVVPREMPDYWERTALDAQAVAARTYAANALSSPSSGDYDICATTMCQVYGGYAHHDRRGVLLTRQDSVPATDTANRILTYKGRPAFAQFSASNGGWTVDGGQPYLLAKSDPYDTPKRSLDPYIDVSKPVSVASVARYFGLARVTSISITSRDGHGTWKGRVLGGSVTGVDASGKRRTVPADGFDFAGAFGLGTTWLKVGLPAAA